MQKLSQKWGVYVGRLYAHISTRIETVMRMDAKAVRQWETKTHEKQPKNNRKTSNVNVNVNVNDNDNDNRERKSVARFTPPTLEEVKAYIAECGYTVNADAFINHYEAIGWKVGKNTMKDWRASVRSWQSREQPATPQQSTSTHNPASKWIE